MPFWIRFIRIQNTSRSTEHPHALYVSFLLKAGGRSRAESPKRTRMIEQCFPHIDLTWAGRPGILTAAQVYLVTHFCFYYYYYLLHFFLSARDNETIRDWITSGKSPLVLCVSYCSFCELKNVDTPSVFPIRWFICGGPQQYPPPTAISSRVSHTRARL